ncbi:MAG TPA: osmotically inducible protein OsmC [Gammaproteobacteria bacterium]|nr:osmotically inducible protein OsmC [Gammaproteobacteria bacterium]
MHPLPHLYQVSVKTNFDGLVSISSVNLPDLTSDFPQEFNGSGQHWSPETLLCAAVADCFLLSFKAIAQASKLSWISLRCDVTGRLEKGEQGKLQFTHFELQPILTVNSEKDSERALLLLEKAEANCLISNSLKSPVKLIPKIAIEG